MDEEAPLYDSDYDGNDEPMTVDQQIFAERLAAEAGEPSPPEYLSKAEATEVIEELREETHLEEVDDDTIIDDDPDLATLNR